MRKKDAPRRKLTRSLGLLGVCTLTGTLSNMGFGAVCLPFLLVLLMCDDDVDDERRDEVLKKENDRVLVADMDVDVEDETKAEAEGDTEIGASKMAHRHANTALRIESCMRN